MDREEMLVRTKAFALRIIRLVDAMPQGNVGWVLGKQLIKSGTSIGANDREAQRASSRKQFLSTMEIALREADETLYWLELLTDANLFEGNRLTDIENECREIVAILTAVVTTTRKSLSTSANP
ncbi:MAG: four helix bundle protein [Planctomycetales bacterium]|nr:four helix bundle protein [Planctomycetales bacterium]